MNNIKEILLVKGDNEQSSIEITEWMKLSVYHEVEKNDNPMNFIMDLPHKFHICRYGRQIQFPELKAL